MNELKGREELNMNGPWGVILGAGVLMVLYQRAWFVMLQKRHRYMRWLGWICHPLHLHLRDPALTVSASLQRVHQCQYHYSYHLWHDSIQARYLINWRADHLTYFSSSSSCFLALQDQLVWRTIFVGLHCTSISVLLWIGLVSETHWQQEGWEWSLFIKGLFFGLRLRFWLWHMWGRDHVGQRHVVYTKGHIQEPRNASPSLVIIAIYQFGNHKKKWCISLFSETTVKSNTIFGCDTDAGGIQIIK